MSLTALHIVSAIPIPGHEIISYSPLISTLMTGCVTNALKDKLP